jgi:hypothetical protein
LPWPDEDATTCPVKLRRQIGGEAFDAECGLPLVDDETSSEVDAN